ncbi:hypothetical protein [Streptomyces sp. TRM 70351]|uniref:hypothetical protein n=1 Tax=Streptomyces sp. TRM 70351 TaxID=3116552 RepID=UPI003FCD6334
MTEGADSLPLQPALTAADVLVRLRADQPVPIVACSTSGEWAALHALGPAGGEYLGVCPRQYGATGSATSACCHTLELSRSERRSHSLRTAPLNSYAPSPSEVRQSRTFDRPFRGSGGRPLRTRRRTPPLTHHSRGSRKLKQRPSRPRPIRTLRSRSEAVHSSLRE